MIQEFEVEDYYDNDSNYKVGERVMVFDPLLWQEAGGDSPQDDFVRPGTITAIRRETKSEFTPKKLRILADIKFDHKNSVSRVISYTDLNVIDNAGYDTGV